MNRLPLERTTIWSRRALAALIASTLWGLCAASGSQERVAPEPTPDQALLFFRENDARIVSGTGQQPIDKGYDGRFTWILIPVVESVVWVDFAFLGSSRSSALPLPFVGGGKYRLVVEPKPIVDPFGTHYFWFEDADTHLRLSYRFAIFPPTER